MKTAVLFVFLAVSSVAFGSLIDDFKDFVKLIPVDKIKGIAHEHLQNDAEFGDVVRYIQGPQWAELVKAVGSKSEWQSFEKYMVEAGLDVEAIVAKIHSFIANLTPGTNPGKGESIRAFLDEVEKVIPLDQLLSLFEEKLQKSVDFKNFYDRISSQQSKQLVEEVRALPEVQRVAKRLIDMGVRLPELLAIIYEILGWGKPSF